MWSYIPNKPINSLLLISFPFWSNFPICVCTTICLNLSRKACVYGQIHHLPSQSIICRICVEIKDGVVPPKSILFLDEYGQECSQEVIYEWIPSQCMKCKTFGHSFEVKPPPTKPFPPLKPNAPPTEPSNKSLPPDDQEHSKKIQGVKGAETTNRNNNQLDKGKAIQTVVEIGPYSNIPPLSDHIPQVYLQTSPSNHRALSPPNMETGTTSDALSSSNKFSSLLLNDKEENLEGHKFSSQQKLRKNQIAPLLTLTPKLGKLMTLRPIKGPLGE